MKEPLVSIIVPCYNVEPEYLRQCIDSIRAQTHKNWEAVFIIDNYLRGHEWKVITDYADARMITILNEGKSNPAISRNKGFARCNGDYICFFDADDWMEPTKIEKQVAILKSVPQIAWCGHYFTEEYPDGKQHTILQHPGEGKEPVGTISIIFRRNTLTKVIQRDGYLFNESMARCDDFDLVLRVCKENSIMIPESLAHLRIVPEGLTHSISHSHQSGLVMGIAFQNCAYWILPYHAKQYLLNLINEKTGFNLVDLKKKVFG